MSALGPGPEGSPEPRITPGLFSGAWCSECAAAHGGCAALGTVEACGDPAEYMWPVHPATTPADTSFTMPTFQSAPTSRRFSDTLIVADRVHEGSAWGVRLHNALTSLDPGRRVGARRFTGAAAVLLGSDALLEPAWGTAAGWAALSPPMASCAPSPPDTRSGG